MITSTTDDKNTYPKPPYDDCEEVWHIFDTPMQPRCAYRAMERDGRIFKNITHKVDGLQYIYWHPDKNGVELWHKKDNVGAWANAIRYLDERFVYACLRSTPGEENGESIDDASMAASDDETRITSASEDSEYDIVTNTMDTAIDANDDNMNIDTDVENDENNDVSNQVQWAMAKLDTFKATAKYRMLYDIPDFTGFAPTWQLSPALVAAMDSILKTYYLTTGETVLYDKRSCGLIWIRRDCSSYEIRTNNDYALQYAQRFIVHQLFTIVSTWHLAANTIPANSVLWANLYTNIQEQQKLQRKQNRQKNKKRNFQARKNKKKQMTRHST